MGADRRCRAAYGVLRRPDRGRHRLEPMQAAAEPRSVTLPGRGDRLLGYPGEPVQLPAIRVPGAMVLNAGTGGILCRRDGGP